MRTSTPSREVKSTDLEENTTYLFDPLNFGGVKSTDRLTARADARTDGLTDARTDGLTLGRTEGSSGGRTLFRENFLKNASTI